MGNKFYSFEYSPNALRFEFESVSSKKRIRKVVEYTPIPENPKIFNLGFGDLMENGNIDDLVVSDNDDLELILSTIVKTIFKFFEFRPKNIIIFIGSTKSRTRLYQIAIAKHIEEAEKSLVIRGVRNGIIEKFVKGVNYDAFLINLKNE